jgi:hypothetical protein
MDVDAAIAFLNELLVLDPDAVTALVEARVECNAALGEHPTVQVTGAVVAEHQDGSVDLGPPRRVGFLGVLNGLFGCGPDGWGFIAAQYNSEEDYVRKPRIVRFLRVPEKQPLGRGEQL